jgi:hypothetical protein
LARGGLYAHLYETQFGKKPEPAATGRVSWPFGSLEGIEQSAQSLGSGGSG